MRFVAGSLLIGLFLFGCDENIPDCAFDDTCVQKQSNLSSNAFLDEPFEVLTMKNREELPEYFQIYQVQSPYRYPAGTVVVDTPKRVLYLIGEQGIARRYPIAVGKEGYQFEGHAVVGRKTHWPVWYPTPDMIEKNPDLEEKVEGGAKNPLGARAIYLYADGKDTLYRIHGNNAPRSIGYQASAGCIRMYNEDVIDLYNRVPKGANVVVIGLNDVPDDVEVEVIGGGKSLVEERELSTWEELFYHFKAQGASDEKASEKADDASKEISEQETTGEFNLFEWLAANSRKSDQSEEETVADSAGG